METGICKQLVVVKARHEGLLWAQVQGALQDHDEGPKSLPGGEYYIILNLPEGKRISFKLGMYLFIYLFYLFIYLLFIYLFTFYLFIIIPQIRNVFVPNIILTLAKEIYKLILKNL